MLIQKMELHFGQEIVNYFHLYMHAFEGLLEFYMVNNL